LKQKYEKQIKELQSLMEDPNDHQEVKKLKAEKPIVPFLPLNGEEGSDISHQPFAARMELFKKFDGPTEIKSGRMSIKSSRKTEEEKLRDEVADLKIVLERYKNELGKK
jgi:hypothetical protein